ncbi:polyprenyl synthetase family protein [Nonomuraea pusilla]|uniref:Geranylgeranyl pyrophosphate synthase n=1 Tax=Nonomuraea pusilla TaxID=46177 RepID=A0A1H7Z6J0_9ACTN|nr:polyprenyl synthetase family protein [Nonomuraea pusilla]SEM53099.1 Geranylgeranyl pyrophosphate synthase [Nonomuraea pusilla]
MALEATPETREIMLPGARPASGDPAPAPSTGGPASSGLPASGRRGTQDVPRPGLGHESWRSTVNGHESWRFTVNLRDARGEEHALMVAFLARRTPRSDGDVLLSHGCGWTHSMPRSRTYQACAWRDAGGVELTSLDVSRGWDRSIAESVREACAGGRPIAPDRLLPGPVTLASDRLRLDFGGVADLSVADDGGYHLVLRDDHETWDLRLRPLKPAITESGGEPARELAVPPVGDAVDGDDEAREAFLVSRLAADAVWTRPGQPPVRMTGVGSYRRVHGPGELTQDAASPPADRAHTRIVLHLEDGWDVVACQSAVHDPAGGAAAGRPPSVTLVAPDGAHHDVPARLDAGAPWTSIRTLNSYPTTWRVDAPRAGLALRVSACFQEQERPVLLGLGASLEAAVTAEGELHGRPVRGEGWLEVEPAPRIRDLEHRIERLREVTHAEVVRLYPDSPEPGAVAVLAGLAPRPAWPVDVVAEPLHRALVAPVRHLADAMGRGWRSYAAIAGMEMQGVDSQQYRALAALAELMHTASLIVDDVEDNAPMRRGRPAVHRVFGQATAINTGTHAYLVFDLVARHLLPDDPERRLRLYQVYLDGMRRSHAGQALDILGHHDAMEEAVASGDAATVLERVRTTHRLKTGGVVRGVGEFGAVLAGADGEVLTAISTYFETIGLAYQISDDVADLLAVLARAGDPGARVARVPGEDIREGKVTYPLACAVTLLPQARLREIWEIVRCGGAGQAAAAEVAETLVGCGATAAALADARHAVDEAWLPLQRLLPVNHHTVMIRALGLYAAERHQDE